MIYFRQNSADSLFPVIKPKVKQSLRMAANLLLTFHKTIALQKLKTFPRCYTI